MDRATLTTRATEIADVVHSLAGDLLSQGIPEPSFEHGLPDILQSDAQDSNALAARMKLLGLLDELRDLLTDPPLLGSPELRNPSMSILALVRLKIFENFPSEGITIKDLAERVNRNENIVRRLMSHAATYHVFFQEKPDFFIHTAGSRVLTENEGMRSWMLVGLGETMPGALKGWNIQNNTDLPVFQALATMPERATIFAKAMSWHAQLPGYSPQYLLDHFPFGSGDITVVDVGGGIGHIARALADHCPTVQCIVQDPPEVILQAEQALPANLQDRIRFQPHDFFQDQPVHGADIYLLRHVLHDWSNKYARKILQALIPALKPGAKVVLNDRSIPGYGEAHYLKEREARDYDLYMLGLQNAQERTPDDWKSLFRDTDSRFNVTKISQPSKSYLSIMEVTWEG
ncbi:O-methyltransferase, COMT, eukaryota [Penicillium camemberti]|uniref:O-methyltransferase, COMT, eukaryota n=1 Tax=Penicillium camemberti (strain FM 013) TaxID=1429867 RepID=A0A0G4PS60_PENC3|nr:O-methyltransferase, COMT, eukaryota [Penicillium camemberti]